MQYENGATRNPTARSLSLSWNLPTNRSKDYSNHLASWETSGFPTAVAVSTLVIRSVWCGCVYVHCWAASVRSRGQPTKTRKKYNEGKEK
ncbi:hypothetical protein CDAR_580181 [Caerostris darwini]|uniref:Uncharacterized protein n=1 Tax=Caerostris darwini TaxID=1538125 RepID=A0AAV4PQM7_9ARAC|nr:hypothetical protein CDAR_580181 [Caerostris darwini]